VTRIICVYVEPHDYARRVDAQGCGALVKAGAGARDIERSHGTVAGPQEAMINGKAVVEGSRDRPRRVNTGGERPYTAGGIGRRIECG
jgi:hypothetical protein